jgi:hypothetical protein
MTQETSRSLNTESLYKGLNMETVDWQNQMKLNALLLDLHEVDGNLKDIFEALRVLRKHEYWFFRNTNIRAAFKNAAYVHAQKEFL